MRTTSNSDARMVQLLIIALFRLARCGSVVHTSLPPRDVAARPAVRSEDAMMLLNLRGGEADAGDSKA